MHQDAQPVLARSLRNSSLNVRDVGLGYLRSRVPEAVMADQAEGGRRDYHCDASSDADLDSRADMEGFDGQQLAMHIVCWKPNDRSSRAGDLYLLGAHRDVDMLLMG